MCARQTLQSFCSGGPLLAALVSGDAGSEFEKQSPEAIVQRVLAVLERVFKPKGIAVPQPVQVLSAVRRAGVHDPDPHHQEQLLLLSVRPAKHREQSGLWSVPADQITDNLRIWSWGSEQGLRCAAVKTGTHVC
jgi:Flavin containing amine oxidoreductase